MFDPVRLPRLPQALVCLALCSCAATPRPEPSTPLVENAEQQESSALEVVQFEPFVPSAEQTEAHDALVQFLGARWTFDKDETLALVTEQDRTADAPRGFFKDRMRENGKSFETPALWIDWEVTSLKVQGDEAVATIDLVRNPDLPLHRFLPWLIDDPRAEARRRGKDAIAGGTEDKDWMLVDFAWARQARPVRVVESVDYKLVRTPQGWRVKMGWADLAAMPADDPLPIADLDGSEKAILERARTPRSEAELPMQTRAALMLAMQWTTRDRHYDDVGKGLADHLRQLGAAAPQVLRDRVAELEDEAAGWKEFVETVPLSLVVNSMVEDGQHIAEVEVTNRSDQAFETVWVHIHARYADNSMFTDTRIEQVGPGETIGSRVGIGGQPIEVTGHLSDVLPSAAHDQRKAGERLLELDAEDALFGYFPPRGFLERLPGKLHPLIARIDACPDWPERTTDVRVTFRTDGTIGAARYRDVEPTFSHCVSAALADLDTRKLPNELTLVIPLTPRHLWIRRTAE